MLKKKRHVGKIHSYTKCHLRESIATKICFLYNRIPVILQNNIFTMHLHLQDGLVHH